MKFFSDTYELNNKIYKDFCLETKNNIWQLFAFRIK